jgi:pimeloyl-ACP methyl ester carboxylesterase
MNDEIRTTFIDAGELRFEVQQCGDPSARELALCLHGFPEHAYSWRMQLPHLAALGKLAWAPNLRGYGRSSRPRGARRYALELLVEDVCRLIDAADCDSVTLIGHDWGGVLAWMVALTEARPIDRLVVMNIPHPAIMRETLRWPFRSPRQLLRSWYALFFQIPWLPERLLTLRGARLVGEAFRGAAIDKSRFPDEVTDFYRKQALEPGAATAMINWYRGIRHSKLVPGDAGQLDVIDVPTLMIWGEADVALGVELTYGTEERVRDLTIRYLPDVSHWVQQEAPEVVNELLEAWLKGAPVPGQSVSSERARSSA